VNGVQTSSGIAPASPLAAVWRNRGIIRGMVRRDIQGRYRGSFGGLWWTFLHPLLLMSTYFFVFGVVLEARFPGDPSRAGFALYFLAGMLPWLAFSEAAGRAPTVLLEHKNFIKKLVFPVETLPVNLVAAGSITGLCALVLFVAALAALRGGVPWTILWLPVLLIPQAMFTAGVCWFLSALGAFVRDLGQVTGFLLTLWFFLTPICYPEASLPEAARPILAWNPMAILVRGYRAILLLGQPPSPLHLGAFWLFSGLVFAGGYRWFRKLRRSLADAL
jgi:lipopolysaccharide transport system permease protein